MCLVWHQINSDYITKNSINRLNFAMENTELSISYEPVFNTVYTNFKLQGLKQYES
jgi:hypothetical protein